MACKALVCIATRASYAPEPWSLPVPPLFADLAGSVGRDEGIEAEAGERSGVGERRSEMTIREHAEELGYVQNCRGCGQKTDTGWCGCAAGEPDQFAFDQNVILDYLKDLGWKAQKNEDGRVGVTNQDRDLQVTFYYSGKPKRPAGWILGEFTDSDLHGVAAGRYANRDEGDTLEELKRALQLYALDQAEKADQKAAEESDDPDVLHDAIQGLRQDLARARQREQKMAEALKQIQVLCRAEVPGKFSYACRVGVISSITTMGERTKESDEDLLKTIRKWATATDEEMAAGAARWI